MVKGEVQGSSSYSVSRSKQAKEQEQEQVSPLLPVLVSSLSAGSDVVFPGVVFELISCEDELVKGSVCYSCLAVLRQRV